LAFLPDRWDRRPALGRTPGEIDWSDVERVIARQHGKLDWDQIVAELKPLLELKGAVEAMDRLLKVRELVERRLRTQRP
jgi:hypothetical protein